MGKEASSNSAVLLREMGIDVWRLRRSSGSVAQQPEIEAEAGVAEPLGPALVAEPTALSGAPAGPAVVPVPERRADPSPAAPPVAPFSVLSLRKNDALLLIAPGEVKAARRFAADLLSAITGVWGGESEQLIFAWPQPGVDNTAAAQGKALGAFVAKQVVDNAGGITLLGRDVVERLGNGPIPDGCMIVAPVDELMISGELKRALWEEIERRQDAATGT